MNKQPSVALVHDWLVTYGGAERVLENLLELFPGAPLYTLIYNPRALRETSLLESDIRTSWLNRWPGAHRAHRIYLPLMPLAVEQFDLREFDIVISLSSAVAHGVLVRPDQLHLNYILSPARFAWHLYNEYLEESPLARGLRAWLLRPALHYFRLWDYAASSRVDQFIAISEWVSKAVHRTYRRQAEVIYPPVDVGWFTPGDEREDYYITVARLVSNKRIDLIVRACLKLGRRLVVVGEGPEMKRLKDMAGDSVELVGWQDDRTLRTLLRRAKAFIHAADEDFGIAMLEAQATGCPVIALGRGAALETIVDGTTGIFFSEPGIEALTKALLDFEQHGREFQTSEIRSHSLRFNKIRFQNEFRECVDRAWASFQLNMQPTAEE
jgi:glycosyltransferase involved in cell wall biosynthesis